MDCCEPVVIKRVIRSGEGCCESGEFQRRFPTKGEELQKLEDYRDQLKKELEGVEEHIKSSKSK
jgi:hypothetical protein